MLQRCHTRSLNMGFDCGYEQRPQAFSSIGCKLLRHGPEECQHMHDRTWSTEKHFLPPWLRTYRENTQLRIRPDILIFWPTTQVVVVSHAHEQVDPNMVWAGSRRQLSVPEALVPARHEKAHLIGLRIGRLYIFLPQVELVLSEVASGTAGKPHNPITQSLIGDSSLYTKKSEQKKRRPSRGISSRC